ncbi:Immunoglobulin subtype,Immunoglobulin-like domain,Immunoglobulin-like fold,Leucine-rich repeat [Cinara cedri]|uniref:Immunoglobulin subtype,Immunoglobulin-like domain,Immunoglobulin-like fold,Leucine-rich repeat n=1 Tax=Cinara cedri TaxID=506608 RepID=A0A5E4N1D9_9HEMI|nr:Immunoglobulin subtype,Immunoglobulin-like domain,Immunoglobulin-like fold,Leucine-rich repeat [Cinara cedri]
MDAGLSNLQRIHAARCKVCYVHDRAFYGLTNLVDLDLSGNCLRDVPVTAFEECPSLMKLSLSGNPIAGVPARAFHHLTQLNSLDLSGCGLTAIEAGAFDKLAALDWLKLNDNRLTHVPGPSTLPTRLHGIDLHRNDWQCDCRLIDMHRWLTSFNVPVAEDPVCSGPVPYADMHVRRIREVELACPPVAYPVTRTVQEVVEGVNVSFQCLVTATPVATVEWLFGGVPVYRHNASEQITVDGNTTAELYVYNASLGDAGTYACVARNPAGMARTDFTVSVRPKQPSLAAGTAVDDRSAPSQSSSAAAGGDGHSVAYAVACLVVGSAALTIAAAVLVAVRCKKEKRGGGRDLTNGVGGKRRPVTPAADGYRVVSTTADKEPPPPTAPAQSTVVRTTATTAATVVTTAAASATATTAPAAATAADGTVVVVAAESCNPDVVSDAKRAGWEIDFEQIVWAECPPATGYVSIQIPVQCGIECLGAYYATTAEAVMGMGRGSLQGAQGAGTVRRQHRRAAVLTAYDDTVRQVRTTAQGGYPTAAVHRASRTAAELRAPTIVVDDVDDCGGNAIAVTPIISPPLPFRSAGDADDSIAL